MHDAARHGDGVWFPIIVELALDPIQDIEGAIGAEGEEIEGVDDGGDGGLAEQEELREDADGFEDEGEVDQHFDGVVLALFSEDEVYEWREDECSAEAVGAELPGCFALAGAGVDAEHEQQDVEGGEDVEDLEDEIPYRGCWVGEEEVDIAGAEDAGIEGLGDEGDTFSASVDVDCEYEDAFREGVGEISQDSKDVHLEYAVNS